MSKTHQHRERGGAHTEFVIVGLIIAVLLIGAATRYAQQEQERGPQERRAGAVVIDKQFAPAQQGSAPLYYTGDGGVAFPLDLGRSEQDRWIVVVRATEGATGIRAVDVSKNLYYRIKDGQAVTLVIMRGGLNDEGKYVVEIDENSVPAPFDEGGRPQH